MKALAGKNHTQKSKPSLKVSFGWCLERVNNFFSVFPLYIKKKKRTTTD